MTAVYLVADSNLFLQCFPLEQLDWSEWRTFDEVTIVLCRPVLAEMDKHKSGPSQRRAKRAKALASQIRPLISQGAPYIEVRAAAPAVKLCAMSLLQPSDTFRENLDLNVADDRIIAIAQRLKETTPGGDVRVLTNDTGMLLSAQAVGLAFAEIPANWLMPPEPSDGDKRLRAIEQRLERLEEQEPRFSVACIHKGEEVERLHVTVRKYAPLTGSEVRRLADELCRRFPMKNDHGAREHSQRMVDGRRTQDYVPASDKAIQRYRAEYAEWESTCRGLLEQLHIILQRADGIPSVEFRAQNVGARPAEDVLVVMKAKGALLVLPADPQEEDANDKFVAFPSPPVAPAGKWEDPEYSRAHEMFRYAMQQQEVPRLTDIPRLHRPDDRDPNAFYYKPRRPRVPVDRYELECQLWRHGVEPQKFEALLSFDSDDDEFSAALQLEIHAGNLAEKIEKTLPVQVRIERCRIFERAQGLIAKTRPV